MLFTHGCKFVMVSRSATRCVVRSASRARCDHRTTYPRPTHSHPTVKTSPNFASRRRADTVTVGIHLCIAVEACTPREHTTAPEAFRGNVTTLVTSSSNSRRNAQRAQRSCSRVTHHQTWPPPVRTGMPLVPPSPPYVQVVDDAHVITFSEVLFGRWSGGAARGTGSPCWCHSFGSRLPYALQGSASVPVAGMWCRRQACANTARP